MPHIFWKNEEDFVTLQKYLIFSNIIRPTLSFLENEMSNLTPNSFLQEGKYKIEKVLGQGSFGITYLGTQTQLNKPVAIKEFFMKDLNQRGENGTVTGISEGSLANTYASKFRAEAQNMAMIEHPNIVRVIDLFSENDTHYYVMDFVEGENLNDYTKSHTQTYGEVVKEVHDIALALSYLHNEKHMLHLDMKPGNVMRRSSDGHIFVIDFGLAKHYSNSGQPETSTTIGLGTPGYAPVEQGNQAKGGEFRPTIDVYALGGTFYKLLTGQTPPAVSDVVDDDQLIARLLKDAKVPEKLSQVVQHAMQAGAKKRIPNMQQFIAELDAAKTALPPYVLQQNVGTASDSNEEQGAYGTGINYKTQANSTQQQGAAPADENGTAILGAPNANGGAANFASGNNPANTGTTPAKSGKKMKIITLVIVLSVITIVGIIAAINLLNKKPVVIDDPEEDEEEVVISDEDVIPDHDPLDYDYDKYYGHVGGNKLDGDDYNFSDGSYYVVDAFDHYFYVNPNGIWFYRNENEDGNWTYHHLSNQIFISKDGTIYMLNNGEYIEVNIDTYTDFSDMDAITEEAHYELAE